MKTSVLLFLLTVLFSKISFGDVIMPNTHYVDKCVKITNVDDYPDISLVGFTFPDFADASAYVLSSSACLTKGYKFNSFAVFAINKSYLAGKDISKIDFPRIAKAFPSNLPIEPYGGYLHDSIPISGIEEFYKIAGFTDSKVILYKWKQITKYNNGKADLTQVFEYEGDVSQLYQKIPTSVRSVSSLSSFELYPNPAHKSIHLKMHNLYRGEVLVEIVAMDGKVAKSLTLNKLAYTEDTDIRFDNLRNGVYYVSLKFGNSKESQKIIIQ